MVVRDDFGVAGMDIVTTADRLLHAFPFMSVMLVGFALLMAMADLKIKHLKLNFEFVEI